MRTERTLQGMYHFFARILMQDIFQSQRVEVEQLKVMSVQDNCDMGHKRYLAKCPHICIGWARDV